MSYGTQKSTLLVKSFCSGVCTGVTRLEENGVEELGRTGESIALCPTNHPIGATTKALGLEYTDTAKVTRVHGGL